MRARSLTGSSGADSPSWPGTPDAEQPADGVQRGGDVPWLRVAVAGLLGLLLALRRVPVVARALTAPGMVSRLKLPHSFRVAEGTAFLLTMASAICPRCSRCPRASATSLPVSLRRWSHAGSRRAGAAARPRGSTRSA